MGLLIRENTGILKILWFYYELSSFLVTTPIIIIFLDWVGDA